jgi:hypothetical protein
VSKHGRKDVWILLDGFDLSVAKPKGLSMKIMNPTEEASGIGDEWDGQKPIGDRGVEIAMQGAFFDTATGSLHEAIEASLPASAQDPERIATLGFAGQVIGREFHGFEGTYSHEYEPVGELRAFVKANVTYQISGEHNSGVILQPLAAQAVTWDTESSSVDNGASSPDGGVGYLQVTAFSGWDDLTVKVRHSADDIAYADVLTFAAIAARGKDRETVAGTVNRHLAMSGTFSGAGPGSATVFCGFSRN